MVTVKSNVLEKENLIIVRENLRLIGLLTMVSQLQLLFWLELFSWHKLVAMASEVKITCCMEKTIYILCMDDSE